jgi:hypothetical protein
VNGKAGECTAVKEPGQRTFTWTIPADFQADDKVKIRLRLCDRAFPEMPELIISNPIMVQHGL